MNNNTNAKPDLLLNDLEEILKRIDSLVLHLNKQKDMSNKDLLTLEQIIFHLDGILIKLNNEKKKFNYNIIVLEIINALNSANEHLKHVLLNHNRHNKTNSSKKTDDNLLGALLVELKKL